MAQKYKAVLTKIGAAKIAAATAGGTKINLTQMAVGDGGGTLPTPDPAQTKLIAEKHRAALNKVIVDPKHKNYLVAELVIPPEIGGFWMRELGLYDEVGALIAVSNMAESYKPLLSEGSGRAQTLRMVVIVSDMDTVNLLIDSSTVLATQEYVDEKLLEHEQSRRHPDATLKEKGFTQLSSATNSTSEALAATPKAVKTAYDLANGKYTAQDASTAQKGIVQLNSATNSTSETLAATPKAVKAAYDLASGKYTAQDATTTQKGIVQLNSATNSESETQAATPKAVKAANDNANGRVPSGRKVNGHVLSDDVNVTTVDIFDGQAINLGTNKNLNDVTTPGIYFQSMNANTSLALNYPEAQAGALVVYKNAGITQEYRVYNSSRIYSRSRYSTDSWTPWAKEFNTLNKPSASDVEALPISGGTVTGLLKCTQEIQSSSANSYRIAYGRYGTFWRSDGANLYLMLTKIDDQYGGYNTLRPFMLDVATGELTLGKTKLSDYAYFDARYYTKAQSDAGYAPLLRSYSKAESDGRFQPKGSYTPAGQAYTKAESDNLFQLKIPASGGVGTYAFARIESGNTSIGFGANIAGSVLRASCGDGTVGGSALAGTWRCCGATWGSAWNSRVTLWIRIA